MSLQDKNDSLTNLEKILKVNDAFNGRLERALKISEAFNKKFQLPKSIEMVVNTQKN